MGSATTGAATARGVTGIIGAMASEVAAIRDAMEGVQTATIAGMEFSEGSIGGRRKVVLAQCGMGKVNAGICAQTLISRYGASRIRRFGV